MGLPSPGRPTSRRGTADYPLNARAGRSGGPNGVEASRRRVTEAPGTVGGGVWACGVPRRTGVRCGCEKQKILKATPHLGTGV